ncbi:MAG: MFS transporter [Desulfobacteraceae bacterium]|nr:MAG: MFS transporter [Desulfobacteraceae bacterium]
MKTAINICAASLGRLALNTARRFIYPFAPAMARGLGVPLSSISSIIAMNQAAGVLVLFTGPLADRLGYKIMMMIGLGCLIIGMFAAGMIPIYGVVMVSLLLAGLGKSIFDPALQAYVGKRVPFRQRGLVIGILEISWAGSTLVGIPVMGLIIQHLGWRISFFTIGGVGLLSLIALFFLIPRDNNLPKAGRPPGLMSAWKKLAESRSALSAVAFAFFISAANDNLFMVYGAWLESAFALNLVAIGIGTGVIGAAELCGEGLTATLADRIGLKRSVLMGSMMVSACYAMLPFFPESLSFALGGLFVVFVANEFTFVSTLALCTELLPEYRATMMSTLLAAAGLGRVAGALCGGVLWPSGGIYGIGLVSSGMSFIGFLLLTWGLRSWKR